MNVRLTCTSKRRVPKNGILSLSTCASSITSPLLMRLAAFITAAAFWWLPEPRSSVAPHLDGQRSFSGGGDQVGACCATVAVLDQAATARTMASAKALADFVIFPPPARS